MSRAWAKRTPIEGEVWNRMTQPGHAGSTLFMILSGGNTQ
jgi:hypothetical protein